MQTAFVDKVSEIFISPKGVLEGRNCFGKTMAKYDCTRPAINHQTEESEKN
jgi:hypothetical protein